MTRGIGSYNSKGVAESGGGISRLNSQLSFTGKESLSRISEEAEAAAMDNHQKKSYATTSGGGSFGMWEASSNNPIMFSVAQPNRGKNVADGLDAIESQVFIAASFHFICYIYRVCYSINMPVLVSTHKLH